MNIVFIISEKNFYLFLKITIFYKIQSTTIINISSCIASNTEKSEPFFKILKLLEIMVSIIKKLID